jgi:hypothetical protein
MLKMTIVIVIASRYSLGKPKMPAPPGTKANGILALAKNA